MKGARKPTRELELWRLRILHARGINDLSIRNKANLKHESKGPHLHDDSGCDRQHGEQRAPLRDIGSRKSFSAPMIIVAFLECGKHVDEDAVQQRKSSTSLSTRTVPCRDITFDGFLVPLYMDRVCANIIRPIWSPQT